MSNSCFGIVPKNVEQAEAIEHLLNPEIDLVILEGLAGSGKTLLALAAGLEQVLEKNRYREIIFTRPPICIGQDLGFLPGTEEEKLLPWCGALTDNLEVLVNDIALDSKLVKNKIKIKAMQYMRGRSFSNKYLIIDEAQNIKVSELKVLLTRAGDNCKVVCLGDREQIDGNNVIKSHSSLAYLVEALGKNKEKFIKSVELKGGLRSRLSAWAVKVL